MSVVPSLAPCRFTRQEPKVRKLFAAAEATIRPLPVYPAGEAGSPAISRRTLFTCRINRQGSGSALHSPLSGRTFFTCRINRQGSKELSNLAVLNVAITLLLPHLGEFSINPPRVIRFAVQDFRNR